MKSYSQAGQDKFARAICAKCIVDPMTYLDVGCHDGLTNSNSRALDAEKWIGVGVDIQNFAESWKQRPRCHFVHADAVKLNYNKLITDNLWDTNQPLLVDYLSLDVDENTTRTLMRILESDFVFRCITIEHDLYRLGPTPRDIQRNLLTNRGYLLVCGDVVVEPGPGVPVGGPFEDWWVHSKAGDLDLAKQYACNGKIGRLIVP